MTNEEALEILIKERVKRRNASDGYPTRYAEALDMAIKSLEQQPSEDMEVIQVSKGALKSRQGRFVIYDVEWLKENFYLEENLYGQPKQPCEDCISRERLLARIDEERKHLLDLKMDGAEHIIVHHARRIIEDMPSATPQPKRGKWIEDKSGIYHCSNCNEEAYWDTDYGQQRFNYCPECGSDNREEADE